MSKYYTLYTTAKLRKGGRTIQKMSINEFAEKARKFIMDNCNDNSWVLEKVKDSKSADRIIKCLPHAIYKIYWNDKKGKTAIKKDFKGIQPDWENFDMVGKVRTIGGAPYIVMSVGGDWECPLCVIVYHDGHRFRCYIPEKGNSYRKDIKRLFGNYDADYDSEAGTYNDYAKSDKYGNIPSDDKYAFDQLVKDGVLDREKDKNKLRGIGNYIQYNLKMCIDDFESRVGLNESFDFNMLAESINNQANIKESAVIRFKKDELSNVLENDIREIDFDKSENDNAIHINLQKAKKALYELEDKMKDDMQLYDLLRPYHIIDNPRNAIVRGEHDGLKYLIFVRTKNVDEGKFFDYDFDSLNEAKHLHQSRRFQQNGKKVENISNILKIKQFREKTNSHIIILDYPDGSENKIIDNPNDIEYVFNRMNPSFIFLMKDDILENDKDVLVYMSGHAFDRYDIRHKPVYTLNTSKDLIPKHNENVQITNNTKEQADELTEDQLFDIYYKFLKENSKTQNTPDQVACVAIKDGMFLGYYENTPDGSYNYVLKTYINANNAMSNIIKNKWAALATISNIDNKRKCLRNYKKYIQVDNMWGEETDLDKKIFINGQISADEMERRNQTTKFKTANEKSKAIKQKAINWFLTNDNVNNKGEAIKIWKSYIKQIQTQLKNNDEYISQYQAVLEIEKEINNEKDAKEKAIAWFLLTKQANNKEAAEKLWNANIRKLIKRFNWNNLFIYRQEVIQRMEMEIKTAISDRNLPEYIYDDLYKYEDMIRQHDEIYHLMEHIKTGIMKALNECFKY